MPVSNPPVQPLITGTAGINTALSPDGTTLTVDGSGISTVTSGGVALGAKVRNSSAITIANEASPSSLLTFDTVLEDNGGFYDGAHPERLTIPANGWYAIFGAFNFAANATGHREIFFKMNGDATTATSIAVTLVNAVTAGLRTRMAIATAHYFSAGDYVVMGAWQDSGGPLDIEAGVISTPFFSVVAVSPPPFALDANADTVFDLSGSILGLDTQSANKVFAGPASGSAAVPAFRSLVADDISGLQTGGQVTGIYRWAASTGQTAFDLPDIAESLVNATDNGSIVDPLTYSLSADATQLVFDSGITAGHVVTAEFIVAQV